MSRSPVCDCHVPVLGIPGSSGVVVGAQKVGKTCLLSHLWGLGNKRKETIFCRVDIDSLQAAGLSDDSFLRLFLTELQNAIVQTVAHLEPSEQEWQTDQQKLQASGGAAPALHAEFIRASLQELAWLRKVDGLIQTQLERMDPLEPAQMFQVFNGLSRIDKRVVVIIDEFHRMMREPGFSNRLFAFLRGQSTQGRILTLVSSPVHLMDPSLHGPETEDLYDRLNLFNHYQIQFLEPFSPTEAEGYLDWLLPSLDKPLTDDEKCYLYKLGGGSPYFLKKARSLFIDRGRPDTPVERVQFERYAGPYFEADFSLLLGRCSSGQRTVLADMAISGKTDSAQATKLEREGYLVKGPKGLQLFSLLFANFASQTQKTTNPQNNGGKVIEVAASEDSIILGKVEVVSATFVSALGIARPEDAKIFAI